jgi:hypothetical protein
VFLPLGLPHVGNLLHDVNLLDARVLAAQLLDLIALVDVPAVGRALSDTSVLNATGLCNGEIARATVKDVGGLLAKGGCGGRAGLLLCRWGLDAALDLHGSSVSTGLLLESIQVILNLVGEILRETHLELLGEAIQNPECKVLHGTVDGIEDHYKLVELLFVLVLPLPKSEHPSSTTQVFEQSVGQSLRASCARRCPHPHPTRRAALATRGRRDFKLKFKFRGGRTDTRGRGLTSELVLGFN